ncbi:hypothetical protein Tco_0144620 [Tanacetum coccineum]
MTNPLIVGFGWNRALAFKRKEDVDNHHSISLKVREVRKLTMGCGSDDDVDDELVRHVKISDEMTMLPFVEFVI